MVVAVVFSASSACDFETPEPPREYAPLPPEVEGPPEAERVIVPPDRRAGGVGVSHSRVVPSAVFDDAYASSATVRARRVVYRVTLRLPGLIGVAHPSIPTPRAELVVDVTEDRIRARFAGTGWPLFSEAEVRIRSDFPGSYVFDHHGGRPLSSGRLRTWFIGDPNGEGTTTTRVRPASPEEQVGAGLLICRLLAEWSGQSPPSLLRRCGGGGAPEEFAVGMWVGRRTADVSIPLPRAALRADHVRHPTSEPRRPSQQLFMSQALIRRIEPYRPLLVGLGAEASSSLMLENSESTRLIVAIEGVPLAWLPPGGQLEVRGISPGVYRFAAIQPMGSLALRYRLATVPGLLRVP